MGTCQMRNDKVIISLSTWNKDTHDLFDYESVDLVKQSFEINKQDSFFIQQQNNLILLHTLPTDINNIVLYINTQQTLIAGNNCLNGNSTTIPSNMASIKIKKNWICVRSIGKYPLNIGDVFRLGRTTFRIYDCSFENTQISETSSYTSEQQGDLCRICLGSGSAENPLLNPCKCMGSVKYLHLECMKRWLRESAGGARSEKSQTYIWRGLKCELCREYYKVIFQSDGQNYHMNELLKPKSPYIMIEYYTKRKDESKQQKQLGDYFTSKSDGIIIINIGNEMMFGRASENWVRLSDVSISRFHATLKLETFEQNQKQLVLYDNNSKYGTLVNIKKDLKINNELEIQVGRHLFKLQPGNSC